MKTLKILIILLVISAAAIAEPGWTKREAGEKYLPHWALEGVRYKGETEIWYMSSKFPDIPGKLILVFDVKTDAVIATERMFLCMTSAKEIYHHMEARLRKIDDHWYIHQPCLKKSCIGLYIISSIEIYQDYYIIKQRLWRNI